MSAPAPVWASFCPRVGCPCLDPDPVSCEEWVTLDDAETPSNPRCSRCGWPAVSHGLDETASRRQRDPLHVQARVRASLLGLAVAVTELTPTLRGEPRFAVARVPGETDPTLGDIIDALPADLDGYVVVQP